MRFNADKITDMQRLNEKILESTEKVINWLKENHYKGFDPADGLTSFLRPLALGNFLFERILLQSIWKSPINLRPILGVKPLDSNIGRGYIVRAHLNMYKLTGHNEFKKDAFECLQWLIDNRSPGFADHCWGKMFDFVSRGGRQSKNEPITVWTSLIGQAFLDAYDLFREEIHLRIADSVSQWILKVPRTITESGSCINYKFFSDGTCTIHNQNMLAAAMLIRTSKYCQRKEYVHVAEEAVKFSCARQQIDGSWYYAEGPKWRWIDSFHTGYILVALKEYIELSRNEAYADCLGRGFSFFKDHFIEKSGRPKYYHDRAFPIDSQSAAQVIETFSVFSDMDETALELAIRAACWIIDNMQDPDGHFYYRRYPAIITKVPMIHWAQATTYLALSQLLLKLQGR